MNWLVNDEADEDLNGAVPTVAAHYQRVWGNPEATLRPGGPLAQAAPLLSIARYRRPSGLLCYATRGLSAANRQVPLELFVIAKAEQALACESEWLEVLIVVSHFHATECALDVGHTVNLGRPWLPGASCDHALVSLPYLDGPELERPADGSFRCLWLVPITQRELEYKKARGVEALESAFESSGVDIVDAFRTSVI